MSLRRSMRRAALRSVRKINPQITGGEVTLGRDGFEVREAHVLAGKNPVKFPGHVTFTSCRFDGVLA